jgi:hypothetical protein
MQFRQKKNPKTPTWRSNKNIETTPQSAKNARNHRTSGQNQYKEFIKEKAYIFSQHMEGKRAEKIRGRERYPTNILETSRGVFGLPHPSIPLLFVGPGAVRCCADGAGARDSVARLRLSPPPLKNLPTADLPPLPSRRPRRRLGALVGRGGRGEQEAATATGRRSLAPPSARLRLRRRGAEEGGERGVPARQVARAQLWARRS